MLSVVEWDTYVAECTLYADNEFSSTYAMRKRRGQSNPEKIKHQTMVGKLGELLAWNYLNAMGYDCSEPDFENAVSVVRSLWRLDHFKLRRGPSMGP